jgi:hypothetical protein
MQTTLKISALEEYAQRQEPSAADEAAHALGMVAGLKRSLRPDFDYDEALIEASYTLQDLLRNESQNSEAVEKAIGFFSGIVFTNTNDVFEAQAAGYQECEALRKMLESGNL